MSEILRRAFTSELELRAGGDGRTVAGLAVPFDQPARITDTRVGQYVEMFVRGAFTRTIADRGDRVKFYVEHGHNAGRAPIGRATLLREDSAGLYTELRVSKTTAGDEALELIRDGALDSFSIGFRAIVDGDDWSGRTVTRREVALIEISATGAAAYDGAPITSVRSLEDVEVLDVADARARLEPHRRHALPVTDAYRRLTTALEGHRNV